MLCHFKLIRNTPLRSQHMYFKLNKVLHNLWNYNKFVLIMINVLYCYANYNSNALGLLPPV